MASANILGAKSSPLEFGLKMSGPLRQKMGYCTLRLTEIRDCPNCSRQTNEFHQPFPHDEIYVCAYCFDQVMKDGLAILQQKIKPILEKVRAREQKRKI